MSFDISKYREMFLEEAAELFESADNVLLAAENNGSLTDDEMGQLFRDVHTLKGSGASVELAFFAEFTHDVENLMDKLRSHKIEYQPEMAETLIDGLDVMKEILELEVSNQINREKFQELTSSLLEEIRAYSNGSTTNKKEEEQITQSVKVLEKIDTPISDEKEEFGFFSDDLNSQRDRKDMPFGIFEDDDTDDKNIGFYDEELENISNNTDDNKFKIDENKENFGFFDGMEKISPNSVMEINDIESETSNENKIAEQEKKDLPTTVSRRAKENSDDTEKKSISNNNNSIRVNLDKIDLLMNNVGDLVITNAMLTQFSSTIEESKTRGSVLERLELLERHIRDMQDSIMSIRMVPMDSIYSKFPKVVRDISKKLGKKVEFKHYGDNVEIDKAMIEGLTDPLMHIIRNSLDHGIEMPEDRIKAGKSDTGTISISAEQANGQMIITIEDDGKGVDSERVAQKALEKGQIDENQFASMSHNDKALLIFGAGLSTADQITDISGRGVGMDVVKTNIHKLGGIIKLDTELGKGTVITIMLPLTLAILDGLDIRVGDQKYILPLSSIVESLQPTANMIKKIGDGTQDLLMLREEFIPVVKLHKLFGLKKSFEKLEDGMLIVVKSGNTKVALSIDEFLNQHQVVVKPLDKNFRSVQGIGAATVRGDGSIGLILDVLGIIDAQIKIEKDMNANKRAS
ncbi:MULTISPECIES: chemotaxis protein CheA [Aliarcobacter]|jgi:two-component system chemotaxis sensor kinase CheA|uniref:Chemotaxis protein CheA n=4 Tax=Arcobacteraceae TaxID=2808963 RepID=A0AAU0P2L9_9BACT|nr:chemotaxis protein CheA [Aliarcobacter cryaerophilus]WNL13444.1 chemotaxis protein CheA [Arcobacter sp. AZ-2023]WPD02819.1 chemotaxis protein CheA [Arcobacter sp. DSM 115972]WPD09931.1 chemotaxis protein CheA [Arcobacter sp. DSM 115954]AYJ78145.1 chemotaxis sensory histidine kinase [Aliarcobacter cryaerophilus D2610]MCT7461601.1 chemotaxis protein CheA [Aliarcobacter cryaerophilus]